MNEMKLFIHIVKISETDHDLIGLSEDKKIWYSLPIEYSNIKEHKELLTKSPVKNAILAIKPINGYRKVGVKIDEDLESVYFDKDGNLCFKNIPLEEMDYGGDTVRQEEKKFLVQRIKDLETQLNLNNEVEKRFILNKFDKKQNATEWLKRYEEECSRHNVVCSAKKIETLRFFVAGSPKEWYEANLLKLGLENWPEWRKSFLTVFVDKGWSKIRKAYNFKYLGGSLVDYALSKEKMCLEIEENCTISSRINMIVVGLPNEVQDRLDKEEIKCIEDIFVELRKLDASFSMAKKDNTSNFSVNKNLERNKDKDNKKPCHMCDSLGWPNRYHPTHACRNKCLFMEKRKINFNETCDFPDNDMKIELENNNLN